MAGRGRAFGPPLSSAHPGDAVGVFAGAPGAPTVDAPAHAAPGAAVWTPDPGARRTVETFTDLAARILARPLDGPRIVAVDGRGAAGKTTFAARLARALGDVPVVHTDDVAARAGRAWWALLEEEVLATARGTFVLEGVSSSRRAIADRLAYAIWLHVPTEPRLARGIARDGGAAAAPAWAGYEAEENAFFAADRPEHRADLVVDGAPTLPHDPATHYVRLH